MISHWIQRAFWILLLGFATGCDNDSIFSEVTSIPEGVWSYDRLIDFSFEVRDTAQAYDIWLDVEHDRDFSYANLYTRIHTVFPAGDTAQQVVSLELTDGMGQWKGSCKGSECDRKIPLLTDTYFRNPGIHHIVFEQYTREENLRGIHTLGLEILPSE